MESIFVLGKDERAAFLRHMLHSFRSTYICLWSYLPPPSNCLVFLDGYYNEAEKTQQPSSSSSGSLASSLFDAYCGSLNYINDNECVPGFAFKNNVPYLEVKVDFLHPTMLATQQQMQFYLEAGIKTAVFMGCATGEIELGFSTQPQVNLQVEIQRWFPAADYNFSTQNSLTQIADPDQQLIPAINLSPPSNSHQNLTTAFTSYRAAAALPTTQYHNPSLFRRSLSFFRNLNLISMRHNDHQLQIDTQIQHVIAERRRRHKLNQSFQILRTNLHPQLFKKDKASVLSSTAKYLSSLRSQMEELNTRNNAILMEMQLQLGAVAPAVSTQRVSVEIGHVTNPSTSDLLTRFLDLRISLRSSSGDHDQCSLSDLVARILGFLKQHHTNNVISLLSLQSNTTIHEESSTPLHSLVLRLKVEGNEEFDESGFQEEVRRVVDEFDLPH